MVMTGQEDVQMEIFQLNQQLCKAGAAPHFLFTATK